MFAAASGILAVAAYLFRTAGTRALLAWIAESLIRRRFASSCHTCGRFALPVLALARLMFGE